MGTALTHIDQPGKPLTAMDIQAQVNLVRQVMDAVMKVGVHFGTIPGCKYPSLWKPGAEKLLSTFRIAIEPVVEDLSTATIARFRVVTKATSMASGAYLGSGVGEASSDEEKYKWREAICEEEWKEYEKRGLARIKHKRGKAGTYTVKQVRTEQADLANTILKMAKKRSQIDVTLTVTGASDCFSQDLEDLPEEYYDAISNDDKREPLPAEVKRKSEMPTAAEENSKTAAEDAMAKRSTAEQSPDDPNKEPVQSSPRNLFSRQEQRDTGKQQAEPPKQEQSRQSNGRAIISEAQAKRFYAIWKQSGRTQDEVRQYLLDEFNIERSYDMPLSGYERACKWAEGQ